MLIYIATHFEPGRLFLKDEIFPPKINTSLTSEVLEVEEVEVVKDDMAPADAPLGTLRSDLVRFMTDTNTTIKRLVSEFIYELCGNDSKCIVIVCCI